MAEKPESQSQPHSNQDVWERVGRLAQLSFLFGALLYIAGWNYLHRYYQSFGLNFKEFSPSQYDVLIFSYPVLFGWKSTPAVAVPLVIALAAAKFFRYGAWLRGNTGLFLIALFVFFYLSFIARWIGANNATRDMYEATSSLPAVRLNLDPSKAQRDKSSPDFDGADFRLLSRASGQVYLFQPLTARPTTASELPHGNITIYVIPESRVQEMKIERGVR